MYPWKQFNLFTSGTIIKRIINDEYLFSVAGSKQINSADNVRWNTEKKLFPVKFWFIQKSVNSRASFKSPGIDRIRRSSRQIFRTSKWEVTDGRANMPSDVEKGSELSPFGQTSPKNSGIFDRGQAIKSGILAVIWRIFSAAKHRTPSWRTKLTLRWPLT